MKDFILSPFGGLFCRSPDLPYLHETHKGFTVLPPERLKGLCAFGSRANLFLGLLLQNAAIMTVYDAFWQVTSVMQRNLIYFNFILIILSIDIKKTGKFSLKHFQSTIGSLSIYDNNPLFFDDFLIFYKKNFF